MKEIYEGLKRKHKPGEVDTSFVDAVYELFREFSEDYRNEEWPRIERNERLYRGDHWHDVPVVDPNEPRPTTPIIQSTIENLRADLTDEFPEAVIRPEDIGDEPLAKVLTEVVAQDLEETDFDAEWDLITHDTLVGGWSVQETGWDADANFGDGCGFIRHVSNMNFMCDPYCADLQDGRACFKFDKLPKEWFRQHYPEHFPFMKEDDEVVTRNHGDFNNSVHGDEPNYHILIEAWFRHFENGKYRVHMVKVAGHQVLENSYIQKPEGYFAHGKYPFVVTPLYTQKGTQLGLGIPDMYGNAQKYSDKLDQILMTNALIAAKPKLLVQEEMVDVEDLRDYSKAVHEVKGNPQAVAMWHNAPPLPSHMLAYMQYIRQTIKDESGTNDFSRGNVSSGVTAASAITALQEMSSKRSRMEARRLHYGFKQCVRMLLEVEREFDKKSRVVSITMEGEPVQLTIDRMFWKSINKGKKVPIEYNISIKTMRETKFTKLANNELMLQAVNIFGASADPVIIFEGMEFEGKELLLEKLRAAQGKGMLALQQQNAELQEMVEQLTSDNNNYKQALAVMSEPEPIEAPPAPDTLPLV